VASTRSYRSPRRERDAAETRQEILRAARELFAVRGYARVTVAEIARWAGTAVKTVYASAGTKADILAELLATDVASSGDDEIVAAVRQTRDLASAVCLVARGTRNGNESHRQTLEIMYTSMASHDAAEGFWRQATGEYRRALREIAQHMADVGALAPGLDVASASDRLWFCFGIPAWRTLVHDCGWSYDEAERWLYRQAVRMLGDPDGAAGDDAAARVH
jgi:AcrR family transcriptional regulator